MEDVVLKPLHFEALTGGAFIMMPTHLTADVNLCASLRWRHSLTQPDALCLSAVEPGLTSGSRQRKAAVGE